MAENLGEENVFNENIKFSFGEVKGGALDDDEDDDEVFSLYSTCFLCAGNVFFFAILSVLKVF